MAISLEGSGWDWETLAILSASISVIFSIMLIMLSRLFDLKQLEQTGKKEFVFAASTVFIVMFVILLLSLADDKITEIGKEMYWTAISFCPDQNSKICQKLNDPNKDWLAAIKVDTVIDLMQLYMQPPAKCTQEFLDYMYVASIPIEACASLFMEIYMSEHMSCFGLKWLAERITNTTQMMTFYMFTYYMLFHMLNFIKNYAGFFFALGVVLRALPPTRGAGAYVMALAVGLYFVLPFSYVLISTVSMTHANTGFIAPSGVDGATGAITYICATPAIGDVEALGCGTESIAKQFELRSTLESKSVDYSEFFGNLHDIMMNLISVICVFPLVAFIILFSFVLNTTNLFGGNIPEIGRGLVRLI
jgi:hypothetical protein